MQGSIDLESREYPESLRKIDNPPKKLYYKGNFREEIFNNCLGVVGSRRMTPYGRKVIKHIFATLHKNITIVSGFMTGVDTFSHRAALDREMNTIAVLPCGADIAHPEDNADLYEEVLHKDGLFLSEYDFGSKPQLWTYPKRNRIIASLCKVILVIEANENSGSLITAEYGFKFGKTVVAVQGNIFNELSFGISQLFNAGAKSVLSGYEINKMFNFDLPLIEKIAVSDNGSLLNLLKGSPLSLDELALESGAEVSKINIELTSLMLKGLVGEDQGKYYAC